MSIFRTNINLYFLVVLVIVLLAGGNIEAASPLEGRSGEDCTELGLKLIGIVLIGENSSFAVFEDEAARTDRRCGLDDSLKGARVLEIADEMVVLEKGIQKCVLKLERDSIRDHSQRLAKTQLHPGEMSIGQGAVHIVTKKTVYDVEGDENLEKAPPYHGLRRHKVSGPPEPDADEPTAPASQGDWAVQQFDGTGEFLPTLVTAELPHFEPVEMAPPSVSVPDLPHFDSAEMPPPEPAQPTLPLPEFTPIVMPEPE
jgi:hypothetical protein